MSNVVRLNEVTNKADQGYRFIERDPVIEELLWAFDQSGLTDAQIAAYAMVSWQTVHNVRTKTKRPHNYTVTRLLRACGFKRVLVTLSGRQVSTAPTSTKKVRFG